MFVVMEEPLDRSTEEPGDGEGQRQGGQIAAGLDRVDRLARDAQLLRELALAEATALTLLAHLVGHGVKLACQCCGVKDVCHPDENRPAPLSGYDDNRVAPIARPALK